MKKTVCPFFMTIFYLGLLFLMVSPAIAEPPADISITQTASAQQQPGSKEPEGLEPEPPSSFSIGWDVTFASKYLFQGRDYSDGKAVVQPEVTLTFKEFSAILWSNYDLKTKEADEFDLYLQYGWEIQDISLTAGYAHFNYPHREGWDPSQEVSLDLSYNALLNPSLSIHYDFDAGDGYYATLGLSHGIETSIGALTPGIKLFYQANYYELTGFPSAEFNGTLEYPIGSFTISPSISYFLTWDNGDFQADGPEGAVSDTWLFSINIAQSF